MNVAVIGSSRSSKVGSGPWPLRDTRRFAEFCTLLGRRLAEHKHFLTVPCDNDRQSADWHCLQGFRKVAKDSKRWSVEAPSGLKNNALPKGHIDAARHAQAVVIIGGANGTYAAGMTAISRGVLTLPIARFGGAAQDLLNTMALPYDNVLKTAKCTTEEATLEDTADAVVNELDGHPRLLIVHGRSKDRDRLLQVLKNAKDLKLHDPVILDYSGNSAEALSNKFARKAGECTGAIVIATPDDLGASVLDGAGNTITVTQFERRARENVWIEMGWFWHGLGRSRILMLVKGDTHIPSDLQDAVRESYQDDPGERMSRILAFVAGLKRGSDVDISKEHKG